jgi:hypothetical protein
MVRYISSTFTCVLLNEALPFFYLMIVILVLSAWEIGAFLFASFLFVFERLKLARRLLRRWSRAGACMLFSAGTAGAKPFKTWNQPAPARYYLQFNRTKPFRTGGNGLVWGNRPNQYKPGMPRACHRAAEFSGAVCECFWVKGVLTLLRALLWVSAPRYSFG